MGIESDIGRIATALETIAEVQSRMLTVAEWNKDRLAGKDVESMDRQPEVAVSEAEIRTAPANPEVTYDQLKAALIARGIEIPKGTKMTTLVKLWEKHQSDPVLPLEDPEAEASADSWAPTDTPAAAEPEPAKADSDIFDDPAPAKAEKKPMTAEEARAILTADFSGTPEDKQLMLAALAKLGVTKFSEVPEGKFEELVKTVKALKAEKK